MPDALARAVPLDQLHTHDVGGIHIMKKQQKYAATYRFGNTRIHVVQPDISQEENERRVREMHRVGWHIIKKLVANGEKV